MSTASALEQKEQCKKYPMFMVTTASHLSSHVLLAPTVPLAAPLLPYFLAGPLSSMAMLRFWGIAAGFLLGTVTISTPYW